MKLAPSVTVGLAQAPAAGQPAAASPWSTGLVPFLSGAVALGTAGALAGYFITKKPTRGAVAGAAIGISIPLAAYLYSGLSGNQG
jgi:hypothetical protein